MADRTGAFLAQQMAFLEGGFTGDMVIQCQNGRIHEMQIKQRIRVAEDTNSRGTALLPNSSALTAVGSRP